MPQATFNLPVSEVALPNGVDINDIKTTLNSEPIEPNSSNGSFAITIGTGSDDRFLSHSSKIDYYNHFATPKLKRNNNSFIRPSLSELRVSDSGVLHKVTGIVIGGQYSSPATRNEHVVSDTGNGNPKLKHMSAYINFLKKEGGNAIFTKTMIALTYIGMLNFNIGNNNTIEKIYKLLYNIVRHNDNLYSANQAEKYKFYDKFVTTRIKNFTSKLIQNLINKTNQSNTNTINISKLIHARVILNRIINIDSNIINNELLKKCILNLLKKIKERTNSINEKDFNHMISTLKQQLNVNNSELNNISRFKIVSVNNLNSAISTFKNKYKKDLERNIDHGNVFNKLKDSYLKGFIKKYKFDNSKLYEFTKAAKNVKEEVFKRQMTNKILELENIYHKNKNEYYNRVKKDKVFYMKLKREDNNFYKFPGLFAESLDILTSTSKKMYNTSLNLKNLKNEYIKNIEQNGANSIPNNDELKKQFKNKPALLREILRKKRSKGSSAVSKIYKDEINYFKKTGKYRPLKAYENNILIGMKNIKGKKKTIENKIKKLEKQKNSKSDKNEKNKINKEISELKNDLKKIKEKISNKEKEVKGGLMNKSKGINIDNEVDSIRRKYQRELMALGKKHLEDLWKSYYSSLTKKNSKYENSKINVNYTKSKKELQKNFGNGFINTYSPPVYKQLATYKKYVEQRMRKLRADVAKAKSPRKIKVVRRVK